MAQTLNPDTASEHHKVSNVNALIAKAALDMRAIDEQRKELNEEAAEIRKGVKEAGITTDAFDFACKMFKREDEARNEYMDSFKQCWEALGIGGQLSFIGVLEEPGGDDTPGANGKDKPKSKAKAKARPKVH